MRSSIVIADSICITVGFNTIVVRWHDSVRSHRQTANQAARRPKLEVLSVGL